MGPTQNQGAPPASEPPAKRGRRGRGRAGQWKLKNHPPGPSLRAKAEALGLEEIPSRFYPGIVQNPVTPSRSSRSPRRTEVEAEALATLG
jgi:hypothetical protein